MAKIPLRKKLSPFGFLKAGKELSFKEVWRILTNKRKRVDYVESNWLKYTGSNEETKKWKIEECYREILYICYNRTMMTYYETMLQFKEQVLESDKYINDNILGKFYKKTILKYKDDAKTKQRG